MAVGGGMKMGLFKVLLVLMILLVAVFYIMGEDTGTKLVSSTGNTMMAVSKEIASQIPESETLKEKSEAIKKVV